MIRLPGLIDPHIHARYMDPHKEDFLTSTSAALAGGYTMVLDMPNNNPPITTFPRLQAKIDQARHFTRYDIGFIFGSQGDNLDEFAKVKDIVFALKLYLNITTGGYIIDEETMRKIYVKWHKVTNGEKPIMLHAEENVLQAVAKIVRETKQPTHICHVSSEEELKEIIELKKEGLPITCGVTPHHLFLTEEDEKRLGPYGLMKPSLKTKKDQEYLWKHFNDIDIVESDHAPHTIDEKESSNPPYGVPGLETTLPLLLTAMSQGRITLEQIIDKCYTRPKEIFHIPDQKETYVEVDETEEWKILNNKLFTKCHWSPFHGMKMKGRVKRVFLRGKDVFDHEKILAQSGFGEIVTARNDSLKKIHVLVSVGKLEIKEALLPFIQVAAANKNVAFYATEKTYNLLSKNGIASTRVYKISEIGNYPNISSLISQKQFDYIINIPSKNDSEQTSDYTDGEIIRRTAAEYGLISITDQDVAEIILGNLGSN